MASRKRGYLRAEKKPRFHQEFTNREIKRLFNTSERTLSLMVSASWRRRRPGCCATAGRDNSAYLRIIELEGERNEKWLLHSTPLGAISKHCKGIIIDIRDNPGGEDNIAIAIINRLCDRKRVAFRRRTKIGPGQKRLHAGKDLVPRTGR